MKYPPDHGVHRSHRSESFMYNLQVSAGILLNFCGAFNHLNVLILLYKCQDLPSRVQGSKVCTAHGRSTPDTTSSSAFVKVFALMSPKQNGLQAVAAVAKTTCLIL